MPEFMVLYKGEATDPADMAPEQAQEVMAKWTAWMERVGSALVDVGKPLAPQGSVVDDGSSGTPVPLAGYSILEAADLAAAKGLIDDHPFLSDDDGKFAIDVYEMLPVPM